MKHLPVPPLRQSLDRYLAAVDPLSDAAQQRRAEEVVEDFAIAEGPRCQAGLMRFADRENASDRSWLSQAWLSGYLTNREPLPLSSNVSFRILPSASSDLSGVARAADVVHRVAGAHLSHLRGDIDDEVSPRGHAIDMRQWQALAGGLRHPQEVEDTIRDGRPEAAGREIGVLWKGRLLMMPISDGSGQPLAVPVLLEALQRLSELPLSGDATFTHLSYLGSDRAAGHLDALLEDPGNAAVYDRLVHALFLVNLTDIPANGGDHQERVSFQPGQAWAYKPFTYQVSLVDDFTAVHVEHSTVDGATLKSMVAVMQDLRPDDGERQFPPLPLDQVAWTMPAELREQISRDVGAYRRQAEEHRVLILQVPVPVPTDMPFTVSSDAIQQWSLLYAQLVAYGRARSTYEAVDMREFQAGRTECLRPVTAEALDLVHALLDDSATPGHLFEALAAHREQVIACKSGQGFDRHLAGLRLVAERLDLSPALFEDESFRRLTTDFLSTTSVGDAQQIVRFTFAPTSTGGIGINYTATDHFHEFCLTHNAARTERIDDFVHGLEAGVSALGRLLISVRDS